jgi:hypothetical protein
MLAVALLSLPLLPPRCVLTSSCDRRCRQRNQRFRCLGVATSTTTSSSLVWTVVDHHRRGVSHSLPTLCVTSSDDIVATNNESNHNEERGVTNEVQ